jgi:hypothetical protein
MIWEQMMLMGACFGALILTAILRSKKVRAGRVVLPLFAIGCAGLAIMIGIGNDLSQ